MASYGSVWWRLKVLCRLSATSGHAGAAHEKYVEGSSSWLGLDATSVNSRIDVEEPCWSSVGLNVDLLAASEIASLPSGEFDLVAVYEDLPISIPVV